MKKSYCLGCGVLAAGAVGLFVVFIVPYLSGPCLEVQFANMQSSGVEKHTYKGWLPEWMPATAVNIREAHDLDTSQIVMRFGLDTEHFDDLTSGSRRASRDLIVPHPCSAKWWDRQAISQSIRGGDFVVYERLNRRQNGTWYFTHDGREVYMWHLSYASFIPH